MFVVVLVSPLLLFRQSPSVAQMKKSLYSHPKAKDRLIPKALAGTHCQPNLIVTEVF
jgi:hypothetical protein